MREGIQVDPPGPQAGQPRHGSALIDGDRVTPATRAALKARLAPPAASPRVLDPAAFGLLRAVCARLVPQAEGEVDVAGAIDAKLAGSGDGWRYDVLPSDTEALRWGLHSIARTAEDAFGAAFHRLSGEQKDDVLGRVQRGEAPDPAWAGTPARRFFEDLIAAAAEAYYAHPLAQSRIGYLGFADAGGWHRIGLDEAEPPEPAAAPGEGR